MGNPQEGYGLSATLAALLVLLAVLPTSAAQTCPVAGCSGCGTTAVDCGHAGLTSFPQLPLDVQQSVQSLRLDNNNIAVLEPTVLENYRNLRLLHLYGNQLTQLPEGLLSTTTQLQELAISFNQFTELPEGLLNATTGLYYLYLHNNQLTQLPEGLLSATTQLRFLGLANNQLTGLPEGLLSATTQLNELYLYGNPLHCDCNLSWLPEYLHGVGEHSSNPATCVTPANLNGSLVASLTEDQLVCECIPECANGLCNVSLGVCECSDGYTGRDCSCAGPASGCITATSYPVKSIAQTTSTGSTVQCPPEQQRSEVIESIVDDIHARIREAVLP